MGGHIVFLHCSLQTFDGLHAPLTQTNDFNISSPSITSVQSLSCVRLCDPRDCSMPGFPAHHHLPELAQTHVHRVGDAIQLSHPPLSPSPPAFRSTLGRCLPSIRVFSNELVLCIRWPKYWSVNVSITSSNAYSRLISFSVNWLDPFAVQRTLKSLLQDHIPNPVTLDCEFFQCLGLQLSL